MKCVTLLSFVIYIVTAKPVHDQDARITDFQQSNDWKGNYEIGFRTSNGIVQHQIGELKKVADDKPPVNVLHGYFFFVAPDNTTHEVRYVSDQFGYRAEVISPSTFLDNFKDAPTVARGKTIEEPAVTETPDDQENSTPVAPQIEDRVDENSKNRKNVDGGLSFPDRIGTPAIISLQGPPGK
ncbi:hypothetical protein PPYR_08374 [Photinus pyralis]|uniref:Cuticle protein n=1 Tax=Photinus pyralis TaxID=7054 RepID=A0A1Y1MNG9_PHOPY|nr:uncharacterized protein LOC116172521 [Photinus pyralis]XP_031345636.1 uncharacterized protein LOC116172543 [Photinus pyralis]KAB0797380.1 hypothetical protein PPYR_08374 [Photinus pyralis]